MKNILKYLYLLLILCHLIYSIFFHSNLKKIYTEKCPCEKNIELIEYTRYSKRAITPLYTHTFKIENKGEIKNELSGINVYELYVFDDSIPYNRNNNLKFHWNCKQKKVWVTKDKYLKF